MSNLIKFPTTSSELAVLRKGSTAKSLNDKVEELVAELINEPLYQALNSASKKDEAVEGSLNADDYVAATMVRDLAAQKNGPYAIVADQKLEVIRRAILVVRRRYGLSRKSLAGEQAQAAE